MKADLTVADSCELSKASAASCAMCLLQRQQPLDHLMVLVIDNVTGTLHMKQRLHLIAPMHLPRSNICPVKLQQTWQLSCCVLTEQAEVFGHRGYTYPCHYPCPAPPPWVTLQAVTSPQTHIGTAVT